MDSIEVRLIMKPRDAVTQLEIMEAAHEIESLRRKLAAALAACEAKDAAFRKIVRMGNHLDVLSMCMPAHEALAVKPDASALKAHDEALIERCAEVCEELKMWPTEKVVADDCAVAIRELK